MSASLKDINEEFKEIELGDWRAVCGDGFSGSGVYKTNLELPTIPSGKVAIDLGDVKHSAELSLNGESLGVRIMSPYTFELDSSLLNRTNDLEIRVSNSAANAFNKTDLWDKLAQWQLSPFFSKQTEFDKDSLIGGLIGPITLKF